MPKWTRTFDSAQRQLVIETPRGPAGETLERITVEIQGLQVTRSGLTERFSYTDMVEHGIQVHKEPPLRIWERLLRRASRVGALRMHSDTEMIVTFWTQPALALYFELADPREADLWRELEIMCLSGGFHFRDLRL